MFLWITVSAHPQELRTTDIVSSIAEELASETETDSEAWLERLSDLAEDPVIINSGSEEEIARLFFLTAFQVKELCSYVKTTGQIVSVYELAAIPGFTRETAKMMQPFISLEETHERSALFGPVKSTILTNITSSGQPDSAWTGSPVRLLSKYKVSSGRFAAGFTLDKDPGEKLFLNGKPEFFSGFVSYKGPGHLRKVVAGDFAARFGQGTAVNTSYGMGLPLTTTSNIASRSEIRPYTSSAENNFFRGGAAELAFGKILATVYLSADKVDATLSEDSLKAEGLYISGLHRTSSEALKKNTLQVVSGGIHLMYEAKKSRFGVVWAEEKMTLPLVKEQYDPRELFSFSGNRSRNYSFYYSAMTGRFLFSGELSLNTQFKHAIVQGVSAKLTDRLTVNTMFRSYESGYSSLHGLGPGSSAGSWNERSFFSGFRFEAARHLFVAAGCDLRTYPWLRYRCTAPSSSVRQEIRIRYLPADNLSAELLYNYRESSYDDPESTATAIQYEIRTSYIRSSVRYSPVTNLTLTSRLDYKNALHEGEGMAFIQDIMYEPVRIPLTFWFRYCNFSISDWDARIYTYENDLLYSFSIPALSGNGRRCYIMVKWEAGDFAEVRFRYGVTEIKNPEAEKREDFRFQVRLFF